MSTKTKNTTFFDTSIMNLDEKNEIMTALNKFYKKPISFLNKKKYNPFLEKIDLIVERHLFQMKELYKVNPIGFYNKYAENMAFLDMKILELEKSQKSEIYNIKLRILLYGDIFPFLLDVRKKIKDNLTLEYLELLLLMDMNKDMSNTTVKHEINTSQVFESDKKEKDPLIRQKLIVLYYEVIEGNPKYKNSFNQSNLANLFVALFGGSASSIRSTICKLHSGKLIDTELNPKLIKLLQDNDYKSEKFGI